MQEVHYDIKTLISSIYECQKKISLNKRFIKELELEGSDTNKLKNEIGELERKISAYQKELSSRYHYI